MPGNATSSTKTPTPSSELAALSRDELVSRHHRLEGQVAEPARQLDWFKNQLFGAKSEKRIDSNPHQLVLGEVFTPPAPDPEQPKKTITYKRGVGPKARPDECVTDEGLRFGPDVPVKTIRLPVPGLEELADNAWELIDTKRVHKLAQRPASYVVIRYETPVVKLRDVGEIVQGISLTPVLDRSLAEMSFLTGLLVDKVRFHLPLYRQHQRLEAASITIARSTLTNLVRRAIALLEPIVDAQLESVLGSRRLAMDETPIKVGKSNTKRGKMHQGYYWPLYGDQHEVVFIY